MNSDFDNRFSQFGQPGGEFDFGKLDVARLKERATELEDSQKGMKKKVNPKVLNMIEKQASSSLSYPCVSLILTSISRSVEKREDELQKMLSTVMKDKEKIEETIEELDRYKRDALQKTWEKVDG